VLNQSRTVSTDDPSNNDQRDACADGASH
jgi:hypothetical protein